MNPMSQKYPRLSRCGAIALVLLASVGVAQQLPAAPAKSAPTGGELWAQIPTDTQNFDRAAVARKIAERLKAIDDHGEKLFVLRGREIKGEDVTAERKAVGPEPDAKDLKDDALRVVKLDPTDEAAVNAMRVVFMTQTIPYNKEKKITKWEEPEAQLVAYLAQLLIQHHANRGGPMLIVERVPLRFKPAFWPAFWQKLYATSTNPEVRGTALAQLMEQSFEELNKPDLSEQERAALREKGMGYAKEIKKKYARIIVGPGWTLPRYLDKRTTTLAQLVEHRERLLTHTVGETLPSIKVANLKGAPDELKNYRGKVLIVDFWATWCGPCRKGHPDLVAMKKEMAGKPFEIIGISIDNKPSDVEKYMKETLDLPWVQWYVGPTAALLEEWAVRGYPTYLLVDANGVVRERSGHFNEQSKALIREMVLDVERRAQGKTVRKPSKG